jgi:hypothetical protein
VDSNNITKEIPDNVHLLDMQVLASDASMHLPSNSIGFRFQHTFEEGENSVNSSPESVDLHYLFGSNSFLKEATTITFLSSLEKPTTTAMIDIDPLQTSACVIHLVDPSVIDQMDSDANLKK